MPTQIAPMLAVTDAAAAIEFYARAFGATVRWSIDGPSGAEVAGLEVAGAPFFLANESPPHGTRAPSEAGHTTVRIELFVDDPHEVHRRAIEAGALERSPVEEHTHPLSGGRSSMRMLQGGVSDPSGHIWLIGKFLD